MLNLMHDGEIVQAVAEGSTFRLPNGDFVSPAISGWSSQGYSLEEAAEPPQPSPDELLAQSRAAMRLSFAQLLIGLVSEQWITQADGEAWLQGILPPSVLATINLIPVEQQFAAKAKATSPSVVLRTDPLVEMMALAQGRTAEELDAFFEAYSTV